MEQPYFNLVRITKSENQREIGVTGRVILSYTDKVGIVWYYVKWDRPEGRYSYHRAHHLLAL